MHTTTKALVLRCVDYKESDKILTVLTQDFGKLTVSARGCRKKNSAISAGCQLLCWSEMVLFEYRGRWAVKEAATLREFQAIRADLEKLALACYLAEVTENLAMEEMPCPELLSLTLNSLHALDQMKKPLELVKGAFELKAMCLAGYEPMLEGCAVCGASLPENPRFHLREGILHCAACRKGVGEGVSMPLDASVLQAMEHIVYGDPKRLFSFPLEPTGLRLFSDLTESYLHTQLERGFQTLDFYKQVRLPLIGQG